MAIDSTTAIIRFFGRSRIGHAPKNGLANQRNQPCRTGKQADLRLGKPHLIQIQLDILIGGLRHEEDEHKYSQMTVGAQPPWQIFFAVC